MISLKQFYEAIEVAGQVLDSRYKAFRMDNGRNKPDMRSWLGLGSCHCCDYFLLSKHTVLIEEKMLADKTKEIEKKVARLSENDREKYVLAEIIKGLRLQIYGSLFMLSRLALQCGKLLGDNTKHDFWFVDSGLEKENAKYFQYVKARLFSDLRSVLTKNFIEDIAVMSVDELKQRLDKCKALKT